MQTSLSKNNFGFFTILFELLYYLLLLKPENLMRPIFTMPEEMEHSCKNGLGGNSVFACRFVGTGMWGFLFRYIKLNKECDWRGEAVKANTETVW